MARKVKSGKQTKKTAKTAKAVIKSERRLVTAMKKLRVSTKPKPKKSQPQSKRWNPARLGMSAAHNIAYAIMNPASAINFRWGGIDETNATAVAQQHFYNESSQASCVGNTELPFGVACMVLFKDIVRAFIAFTPNPAPTSPKYYCYQAYFAGGNNYFWQVPAIWSVTVDPIRTITNVDVLFWNDVNTNNTTSFPAQAPVATFTSGAVTAITLTSTGWSPHGPKLYTGTRAQLQGAGSSYVFLNAGDVFMIGLVFSSTTPDAGLNTQLNRYVGPSVPDATVAGYVESAGYQVNYSTSGPGSLAPPSGCVVYLGWTVTHSAYYSLAIGDTSTGSSTFQGLYTWVYGAGDCLAHYSIPSFATSASQFVTSRVNAASLLVTNTASALNRSGEIVGAYYKDGGSNWHDKLTLNAIASASTLPVIDTAVLPFETGMYTYMKPTADMSFKHPVAIDTNGSLLQVNFFLDSSAPYTIIYMKVAATISGSPSTSAAPGLEYLFHYDAAVEFQTESQVFETHYATGLSEDYVRACDIMKTAPVFMENPLHLAGVAKAAMGVGRVMAGPAISALAGYVRGKLAKHASGTMFEPLFK